MSNVQQPENSLTQEEQEMLAEIHRTIEEDPEQLEELIQTRKEEFARVLQKASVSNQRQELTDEQAQHVEAIQTVLTNTTKAALVGLGAGIAVGALTGGLIVPGVGTILGAGVGATVGLLHNLRKRRERERAETSPRPEQIENVRQVAQGRTVGTWLLDQSTNEACQTIQSVVDQSGNIIETTIDEAGNLVDEEIVGSITDLTADEEFANTEGQIVRILRFMGNGIRLTLDATGKVYKLDIIEPKEEVTEATDSQSGSAHMKLDATEAARRKATELDVDLSTVQGSGANGRILVKDIVRAANQRGK
jgi:pyruvate/2-oxoglutarate dehydrogenase complex dihydrolipoamide acyltransferase (E2) component